jgi:hypothetical protein
MHTLTASADLSGPIPETHRRTEIPTQILALRERMRDFAINCKPDPTLTRELQPGFLLHYLLDFDHLTYGRWDYWTEAMMTGTLPDRPIPLIDWLDAPDRRTHKMLETALDAIPRHGSWQSMGAWEYFRYLLAWMLWGFGHPGYDEPAEPAGCDGASMRLYQVLNICTWMLWPYDYLGDLMAENTYGKRQGFFPTPMPICTMLASMLMDGGEDMRTQTVSDPAVGTGRFLLAASNHSVRLCGQDIDQMMCQATIVNGYLFVPWLAKPFPFLTTHDAREERELRPDCFAPTLGVPHPEATRDDAEIAAGSAPSKTRRRAQNTGQGSLF